MTATTYLYGDLELELSDADVKILLMIADDKQQRDIAEELRISICNAGRKKGRLLDRLSRETGLPERGIPLACRLVYALALKRL